MTLVVARFPSFRMTRVLLWVVGVPMLAGLLVTAPDQAAEDGAALVWYLPGLVALGAGVISFRLLPDNLAARRLVLFGLAGSSFNVVGFAMLNEFGSGSGAWIGPVSLFVQVLGLALGAALVSVLAVYPDGVYQRRYEPVVVWVLAAMVLAVPLAMLMVRETIEPPIFFEWVDGGETGAQATFPTLASPIHVSGLEVLEGPLRAWFGLSFNAIPLLGALLVGMRYRRFQAEGRLQLRWPMYGALGGVVLGVEGAMWQVTSLPAVLSTVIEIGALVVIGASLVIGLVKPDLFDVDRAVLRTVVFVPLWLAIAAGYVGLAAFFGLAASGQGLDVAVVVAVAATVTFEPVRRFFAHRAGRWAYGESVDGEALVRQVGAALEHTHDVEALAAAVASTAREGLGVAWVRVRVAGTTSAHDGSPAGDPALRADLEHGGELLGELACGPAVRGREPDAGLFETLARQTSLAVHNARLADELTLSLTGLRLQAAELSASRARLVAAEETARRRIERDIHDGAQQELVALIARIGLAQQQLRRADPIGVGETLAALGKEAAEALVNLRTLAAGIHPALLSDQGLVAALVSRANAAPLPVTVRAEAGLHHRRFDEQLEGTAYFVACEALTNALKHSAASTVCIRLEMVGPDLQLSVTDDGTGFTDPRAGSGSGLAGLGDRLQAIDGQITVESAPGRGTRVVARLPVENDVADPAPEKIRV
jgi:signal transduction histidine kinase